MARARHSTTMRLALVALALALLFALASALRPTTAAAHPLGNFTINRYSKLVFANDAVTIEYALDFAEIPTFQEMERLDTDGDGALSAGEADVYLAAAMPELLDNLKLVVGGERVDLRALSHSAILQMGESGLPTLRIDATLAGELPAGWQRDGLGGYTDRNYNDRLGWREIVIQGGDGVALDASSAPAIDVSNGLRTYPDDKLASPLDMSEATFTLVPGNGAVAQDVAGDQAERIREDNPSGSSIGGVTGWMHDQVVNRVAADALTPGTIAVALLLAFVWGAVHALSPGHGKTVVAAYLVGARGTAQHAAFLGLTVTITHTIGVFALGVVTLYLSRYILPEDLYPWLSAASGVLVVAIGLTLVYRRLRNGPGHHHHHDHNHDHGHGHEHEHEHEHEHGAFTHTHDGHTHTHAVPGMDGSPVTWRSLLALGVSGGLLPCPSALVLLLLAISLERLELGMVLVVAFSFGLAAVLTAIGLLLVYARRFFERFSLEPRIPRLLPVASAAAISIAGLAIVVESLRQAGVV